MLWLENLDINGEIGKESLHALLNECKSLRTSILKANTEIRKLSQTSAYRDKTELLKSVPGIGLLTAMIILTELEQIERFGNLDRLCSYIGLIPSTKSSGESEKVGDLTPRGHSVLRSALIESSWIAIRNDPALIKCYLSYCNRMKPSKAIIKIARKLLNRIRFVLKNNKPYVSSIV